MVLTDEIVDAAGVERTLLAAARGAGLDVAVHDAAMLAALVDGLARLGTVVRSSSDEASGDADDAAAGTDPLALELDDVDRVLVAALASGSTVMEAAAAVGYSRRQVQRRLEDLRARTGAATNAEVVAALARFVPD